MKHILHTKENSVKPSFWAFHYEFVVRDEFLEKPFVYKILTPVSLEVGQ